MTFYAHSADGEIVPSGRWQVLSDHLRGVGQLARQFAVSALPGNEFFAESAALLGLLHDVGKYRPEFQQMLVGKQGKNELTRHKLAGAAYCSDKRRLDLALAIAGHHGGMPDRAALKDLIAGPGGRDVVHSIWTTAVADCAELNSPFVELQANSEPFFYEVLTRTLFGCLVDADWQDTAAYERRTSATAPEPVPVRLDPDAWLLRLLSYIDLRSRNCRDLRIAKIRNEILEAALEAADQESGLFTMTVPTGGGKTLSGLAFAIKHAKAHGLRRIIYVAPYLSILEQNTREIRRALQVEADPSIVFEHHSLAEPPGGDKDAAATSSNSRRAENWDAPIVVTTNVQFFESLFSNQPGQCRKLHNVARSVVILDECQTLPPDLVAPTCSMLGQLARLLQTTVVLCTATQPAWDRRADFPDGLENVREIIPARLDLFQRLCRVRIQWPKDADDVLDWPEVAERMLREPSALCIVNTRKAARQLFDHLRQNGCSEVMHLSTTMCPAHRLEVIDQVRKRLEEKKPCFLVSTQLIECGCDVDFPLVLRELAPLEAVIQSAGRCNREGLLNGVDGTPGGRTIVFRSREATLPPDRWYRAGRSVVEQDFLRAGREPDIGNPKDIADYFLRLYRTGDLDQRHVQTLRQQLAFAEVAKAYRLIDAETFPVIVTTWDLRRDEVDEVLQEMRRQQDRGWKPGRALVRKLAPFQVNLRTYELNETSGCWNEDPAGLKLWTGNYDAEFGVDAKNNNSLLLG